VLVSERELAAPRARAPERDLCQTIEEWRGAAGAEWPDVADAEVDEWRDRSPGRAVEWSE
jgi:hypothetical protein